MKNGNPIGGLKIVNNAEPRFNRMNNINIRLNHQNQIQMNAEVNKDKKSEAQERGRGSEKNKKMGTRSSINNNMDLE